MTEEVTAVARNGELPTGSFEECTVVYAPGGRGGGGGATSVDGATVNVIVCSYETRVLRCVCVHVRMNACVCE